MLAVEIHLGIPTFGLQEGDLWVSAQGCCDECFWVEGCRFIFAFRYLWVSAICFFLIRISIELKILQGRFDNLSDTGWGSWGCPVQGQVLDWIILVGVFQLSKFCDHNRILFLT